MSRKDKKNKPRTRGHSSTSTAGKVLPFPAPPKRLHSPLSVSKSRPDNTASPSQPVNPYLKAAILEVVDNQIAGNNPPQTRQTFERLVAEGFSVEDARKLIGQVVVSEIFDMLKIHQPFDEAGFIAALNRLPGRD